MGLTRMGRIVSFVNPTEENTHLEKVKLEKVVLGWQLVITVSLKLSVLALAISERQSYTCARET